MSWENEKQMFILSISNISLLELTTLFIEPQTLAIEENKVNSSKEWTKIPRLKVHTNPFLFEEPILNLDKQNLREFRSA